jgi:hypothetical protein
MAVPGWGSAQAPLDILGTVTARQSPRGYLMLAVRERVRLLEVTYPLSFSAKQKSSQYNLSFFPNIPPILLITVFVTSTLFVVSLVIFKALDLPRLDRRDGWEILLFATGTFTFRGAMGVLVNERCQELSRVPELTGSLTHYNMLSSALPQETRVFFRLQVFITVQYIVPQYNAHRNS